MTIYEITDELATLTAQIMEADGEVDDATNERFDELLGERDRKADAYIALIKNHEAEAAALKAEADRLAARAQVASNVASRLKDRLKTSMTLLGEDEIKGRLGKVRLQRSVSSSIEVLVEVDDLPKRFQRVKAEADKTALKTALADMDEEAVRLARVVTKESRTIRIY
jgi:hypothetical protein